MGTFYISENGRVCRFRYLPRYCNAHNVHSYITPAQDQERARLILQLSLAAVILFVVSPNQRRSFSLENLADAQNLTFEVKHTKRQILILPVGSKGPRRQTRQWCPRLARHVHNLYGTLGTINHTSLSSDCF